jgi:hypothetical protein
MKKHLFIIFFALSSLSIYLGNFKHETFHKSSPEVIALDFVFELLSDTTLLKSDDRFSLGFRDDFLIDMMPFYKGEYYSNGKLCLITGVGALPQEEEIGFSDNLIRSFLLFRKNISVVDRIPKGFDLPDSFNKATFKEFSDHVQNNSFFLVLRESLNSGDYTLVEIHVVPYSKVDNPFEYTFALMLEKGKVVNWTCLSMGDFEYCIDC